MTAIALEPTAVKAGPVRIVLLNASYEVLSENYGQNKAARLLAKGKAIIDESVPGRFLGPWTYPLVLRLKEYVKIAHERIYGPPRVSKRGVLVRDKYVCAYDSCTNYAATIDHVIPRSKGGKNTWQNLVAACSKCNHRKRNRTPVEAGMVLKWQGRVPTRAELLLNKK